MAKKLRSYPLIAIFIAILVISALSTFFLFFYKPKATLIKSQANTAEEIVFNAVWESTQSVPEVTKWYLKELQKNGFTLDVPPADPEDGNIQFAKLYKERYILNISFIKNHKSGKVEIVTEYLTIEESEKEGKFIYEPV